MALSEHQPHERIDVTPLENGDIVCPVCEHFAGNVKDNHKYCRHCSKELAYPPAARESGADPEFYQSLQIAMMNTAQGFAVTAQALTLLERTLPPPIS